MLIAILLAAQGPVLTVPVVANQKVVTPAAADPVCETGSPAGIIVQGGKTADSGIIVQGGKTADSGIIVQGGRTARQGIIVQGGLQPSAAGDSARSNSCRKKKD